MVGEQAQTFISFSDFVEEAERTARPDNEPPPYAHPIDGWILGALQSTPVKNALDRAIDAYISMFFGRFVAESVPIDHRSFPELYDVLSDCSRKLSIAVPHALTGTDYGSFNAFTAGTDEYAFIFLTDTLLKQYSRDEATFVIGHECGHIASKHMVYHTLAEVLANLALGMLGPVAYALSRVAGVALLAWSRRSEITSDRAGLICCGDLQAAERALVKLVTGFADIDAVDIDEYLRHYRAASDYHGSSAWQEVLYTHPMIPKRIEGLRLFARSELYYDLTAKPRPPGGDLLTRAELNQLTNHLVRP